LSCHFGMNTFGVLQTSDVHIISDGYHGVLVPLNVRLCPRRAVETLCNLMFGVTSYD
jgi:hypothetical protein